MRARIRFLLPTIGNAALRFAQFVVLLALTRTAHGSSESFLVAGFGILSAFAIITDSGAGNYLLATPADQVDRSIYGRVCRLHFGLSLIGVALAIGNSLRTSASPHPGDVLLLLALALSQALDGLSRVQRAPMLTGHRDAVYSIADFCLAGYKIPVILISILLHQLDWLYLLPVGSLITAVVIRVRVRDRLSVFGRVERRRYGHRLYPRVLEYGLTGALSAFYSQAPLLIGAALLPVHQVASLAVAYRIVQALELIPGTMALQVIPRVRQGRFTAFPLWSSFVLGALVLDVIVIACGPLIEDVLKTRFSPFYVFAIIASAFVPKSGNYALVSYALGSGMIRARLIITASVGVLTILLTVALTKAFEIRGIAFATPSAELMLTTGFTYAILRRDRRRGADRHEDPLSIG